MMSHNIQRKAEGLLVLIIIAAPLLYLMSRGLVKHTFLLERGKSTFSSLEHHQRKALQQESNPAVSDDVVSKANLQDTGQNTAWSRVINAIIDPDWTNQSRDYKNPKNTNDQASASTGEAFQAKATVKFSEDLRVFGRAQYRRGGAAVFKPLSACEGLRKWAILTTVQEPMEGVRRFLYMPDWCLIVIGDQSKPSMYKIDTTMGSNVIFFDGRAQEKLAQDVPFLSNLPWHSFGRKNVGFLIAVANGAEIIWDFDDDNLLKFFLKDASYHDPTLDLDAYTKWNMSSMVDVLEPRAKNNATPLAFNPYPLMNSTSGLQEGPVPENKCPTQTWPRGFPYPLIQKTNDLSDMSLVSGQVVAGQLAVLQSLADIEPDVDAVFRQVQGTPRVFSRPMEWNARQHSIRRPVMVPTNSFTPYNAQATLHFQPGFFGLYLPVTVNGRVSDIWRSYVAQAVFQLAGLRVGFAARPLVVQARNAHNINADFNAEIPLYEQADALIHFLHAWVEKQQKKEEGSPCFDVQSCFEDLYIELFRRRFVDLDDVTLTQDWLLALTAVGYQFPNLPTLESLGGKKKETIDLDYGLDCNVGESVGYNFINQPDLVAKFMGEPEECADVRKNPKTFWTSDEHLGTRIDFPSLLANLNQSVILADPQHGSETLHANTTDLPQISLIKQYPSIVEKYVHSQPLPQGAIDANYKEIKDWPEIKQTDAFFCMFPAARCQLWEPFNKTMFVLPAHRFHMGRCSKEDWGRLNRDVSKWGMSGRHVVGGVSRYDLEYLRYFTGLNDTNSKLWLSSGRYYTHPGVNDYGKAINASRPFKTEIPVFSRSSIEPHTEQRLVQPLTEGVHSRQLVTYANLLGDYKLSDLVEYEAIVLAPYSVMSYKFTELYALAIPLLIPSPRYIYDLGGFGDDRSIRSIYCIGPLGEGFDGYENAKHADCKTHVYGPNVQFQEDPEAEMYWLQFADWFDRPHLLQFDTVAHLDRLLAPGESDFATIHRKIKYENLLKNHVFLQEWCKILKEL